jgi:hypothetical protein
MPSCKSEFAALLKEETAETLPAGKPAIVVRRASMMSTTLGRLRRRRRSNRVSRSLSNSRHCQK